jgi:hypothetical protein
MDVLVFSTTVQSLDQVKTLAPKINSLAGRGKWNFALDDCDKILRIVSDHVKALHAISLLKEHGFDCHELPD